ncbi:MAG TPA: ABC transporter substrate-binding protein [Stellaceae bacterium]|nr:ABC transporter substrate-binding protein [Stellaceae bacterium]
MKRRRLITLLGAAVLWPVVASAQGQASPVVGFVSSRSADESAPQVAALLRGLEKAGYRPGRDVEIEYRWAEGRYDRLPALVADLVRSNVTVIIAAGGFVTALAAKGATSSIPTVFIGGESDPVKIGLVASLSRPGANITGVSILNVALASKRLQLLHELAPKATRVAILANPNTTDIALQTRDLEDAAKTMGLEATVVAAGAERDFDAAFAAVAHAHADALIIASDPFLTSERTRIVALAAQSGVPVMYDLREYAAAGGLMSYGPSLAEAYRQAGRYAGEILKGTKPADLPVIQSSTFELVINLKTAKALGLEIPASLLASADEVIE